MLVVLDTTAIVADPYCGGIAWRVLAHARDAWGVRAAVSDVTVLEAVAGYRRRLGDAQAGLDRWATRYVALGLQPTIDSAKADLRSLGESYPERLAESLRGVGVEVVPVPPIPHTTLVERATMRLKPCDQDGNGYRDTLNWLLLISMAKREPTETTIWVSDNSKDFANAEATGLHEELVAELDEQGLAERVIWAQTLGDAVLRVAESHAPDVADIKALHRRLRDDTVRTYLEQQVFTALSGTTLDARRCALPLATRSAILTQLSPITKLTWTARATVKRDETVAEFSAEVDVAIVVTFPPGVEPGEDENGTIISINTDGTSVQLAKPLMVRGLLTVDQWDKPVGGEVTRIEALSDDPGRRAWVAAEWLRTSDMLKGIQFPTISPDVLKGIQFPTISPDVLKGIQFPTILPEIAKFFGTRQRRDDTDRGTQAEASDETNAAESDSQQDGSSDTEEPPDTPTTNDRNSTTED